MPKPTTADQLPVPAIALSCLGRTFHGPNLFRCLPPVANQFLADAEVPSCCPVAVLDCISNSSQLELRSITSSRSIRRHHKTRSSRSPRSVARCRRAHYHSLDSTDTKAKWRAEDDLVSGGTASHCDADAAVTFRLDRIAYVVCGAYSSYFYFRGRCSVT